jgi:pimeloyl-ACP methyl ester carboxylesterase
VAAKLFFKPRRSRRDRTPSITGLERRDFFVESSFGRLAAWSWGDGPTVLCAHGWEGFAGQFVSFVQPLVSEGFRVVAFDMPAHGRSEGTHVSVVDMAQAIREVAEDAMPLYGVRPRPLHALLGHSLGGAAATLAIHEGLPVRRAVLLAPVAEPTPFARRAAAVMALSPERTAGMMDAIRREVGRDFDALDVRRFAPELHVPALVFHDPADRDVPFEHGQGIAQAWPGARFVPLSGLGHRRLLSDDAVVRCAARFVADATLPAITEV